jgi:pyruvate dehydrogenase E2 component (dihydrolipoamide acetyltransferase)
MSEFRMPRLGADMEAGTVLEWHVKPGDRVRRGDLVVLIDTDKASIEAEIFEDGIVDEILVAEGAKVAVGTPLARIRTAGVEPRSPAPVERPSPAPRAATPPAASVRPTAPPATPIASSGAGTRVHASPLARRVAVELGVDIAALRGSGPEGAILRADVERAAGRGSFAATTAGVSAARAQPSEPAAGNVERGAAMRRAIAAAMSRSKREIPHYYLSTSIDFSHAQRWLDAENAQRAVTERLLPVALLLKAVALALHDVPELNGFHRDGAFQPGDGIHLGVAVALRQGGLVAPALHHADRKTVSELMAALTDVVGRARTGGLRGSEVTDATITVTNLGDQGVESVFGVIHPPQVAIVGFGRIRERAWAENGLVGARPSVTATLAADHRVSDGHRGGRFLGAVERLLRKPEAL